MEKKDKAANIKQLSKKWQVNLYRLVLKITFIALYFTLYDIFSSGGLLDANGDPDFKKFAFSAVPAILGAFLYQIIYFFYKIETEGKVFGRESEAASMLVFIKLGAYCVGTVVCVLGAHFAAAKSPWFGLLILPGALICQTLHNNSNISSHISTFSENLASGLIIIAMVKIFEKGKMSEILLLSGCTVLLFIIKNVSYHYFSTIKHSVCYVGDVVPSGASNAPQTGKKNFVPRNKCKNVINRKKKKVYSVVSGRLWKKYYIFDDFAIFRACEKNFDKNVYALTGLLLTLEDRIGADLIGTRHAVKLVDRTIRCLENVKKKAGEDLVLPASLVSAFVAVIKELDEYCYIEDRTDLLEYAEALGSERITDEESGVPIAGNCPEIARNIISTIDLGRIVFVKDIIGEVLTLFVWNVLCRAELFSGVIMVAFATAKDWLPILFTFITTGIGVFNFVTQTEKMKNGGKSD